LCLNGGRLMPRHLLGNGLRLEGSALAGPELNPRCIGEVSNRHATFSDRNLNLSTSRVRDSKHGSQILDLDGPGIHIEPTMSVVRDPELRAAGAQAHRRARGRLLFNVHRRCGGGWRDLGAIVENEGM
jgi:hypothetical protein